MTAWDFAGPCLPFQPTCSFDGGDDDGDDDDRDGGGGGRLAVCRAFCSFQAES